jgi:hypothetical protein
MGYAANGTTGGSMQLPREMIVERLRGRGEYDASERAGRELPEKVDTENDAELLSRFGIDPQELAEDFRGQAPEVG